MKNGMSPRFVLIVGALTLAFVVTMGIGWEAWCVQAADDDLGPNLSLSAFMRKKLDASSLILEGLTTEDTELILRGTKTLNQLSRAEKWQILSDPDYREFSSEFRSAVKKLTAAAEKKNFDNAALQWFDTIKCCIECHQHVRRERATQD